MRYRTEPKQGEVRVASLDGKLDAPVVSSVNLATAVQPISIYWPQVLAYTP